VKKQTQRWENFLGWLGHLSEQDDGSHIEFSFAVVPDRTQKDLGSSVAQVLLGVKYSGRL
jgi:hypothetical protein